MRILCLCREKYPSESWASFVLFHHATALEDLGEEVHLFNPARTPLRLADYLEAYAFDLLYLDAAWLGSSDLWHALLGFRRRAAVKAVAALLDLPGPPEQSWELVDFAVTPWEGVTVDRIRRSVEVRHLPLGYSTRLHRRYTGLSPLPPIFAGDTRGRRAAEASSWLDGLEAEGTLLCVGPAFAQKRVDPFALGQAYSAARCAPNFHYSWCVGEDQVLNERFWQSAASGIPVCDDHPLAEAVLGRELRSEICCETGQMWQDRVRAFKAGSHKVTPALLDRLDRALAGHSYTERMKTLLAWLE